MNIAIILSGGTGTRMGLSIPKQYVEVNGIPVIQLKDVEKQAGHPNQKGMKAIAEQVLKAISK